MNDAETGPLTDYEARARGLADDGTRLSPVPAVPPEVWHQPAAVEPDYMKAVRDLCKGAS